MKQDILLLYAGAYAVPDERTGEVNEGCSVSYYMLTDLSAIKNPDGTLGLRPAKCTVDTGFLGTKIVRAPAMYSAEFGFKIGSNGKPTLYITGLEYKSDIIVDSLYQASEKAPEKK